MTFRHDVRFTIAASTKTEMEETARKRLTTWGYNPNYMQIEIELNTWTLGGTPVSATVWAYDDYNNFD